MKKKLVFMQQKSLKRMILKNVLFLILKKNSFNNKERNDLFWDFLKNNVNRLNEAIIGWISYVSQPTLSLSLFFSLSLSRPSLFFLSFFFFC